eukprot:Awhi_evm1s4586
MDTVVNSKTMSLDVDIINQFTNKGPTDFSGTYTLVYKLSVQGIYPIIVPTLLSTG